MPPSLPLPPLELANRVGTLTGEDPYVEYERIGREARERIVGLLPDGFLDEPRRILDFGCGAGRVLRHFADEAAAGHEVLGCDLDEASIEWLGANLSPPFQAFVSDAEPPLPIEGGALDLVFSVSVFTHLTDTWAPWLLELHRVLAPGGILVTTFMAEGMLRHLLPDETWDDERFGMTVIRDGQSWALGGPMVFHAPWWIEAHWGRAFEVLELERSGFALPPGEGQGVVALRRRDVSLDVADLVAPERDEPREGAAAAYNLALVQREAREARATIDWLQASLAEERAGRAQAEARAAALASEVETFARSTSWRITRPLRAARQRLRGTASR